MCLREGFLIVFLFIGAFLLSGIFLPMLISTNELPLYVIVITVFFVMFLIFCGYIAFIDFFILKRGKKRESNRKKK